MKTHITLTANEAKAILKEYYRQLNVLPSDSWEVKIENDPSPSSEINAAHKIKIIKFLCQAIADFSIEKKIFINPNYTPVDKFTPIEQPLNVGLAEAKQYVENYFNI